MEKTLVFQGRVWRFGDSVDTDQILPGYAMSLPREKLKCYAMAGSSRPEFTTQVRTGDIVVGGNNFGCGSSREQAPLALKDSGVALIIAESFGRIFRRNAINIGLPVLQANARERIQDGDIITVDVCTGRIVLSNGKIIQGQIPGHNVIVTLAAGGLINRVRRQLAERAGSVRDVLA
jgi:3-isopropylmalate dehydratase small subunit